MKERLKEIFFYIKKGTSFTGRGSSTSESSIVFVRASDSKNQCEESAESLCVKTSQRKAIQKP